MEEKTYTITLSDGTEIKDLKLNGNNFVSKTPIDVKLFKNNLSHVTIYDGEIEDVHENMEFLGESIVPDGYGFIIRDIPCATLKEMKLRSDVEYLAMMCGVDL